MPSFLHARIYWPGRIPGELKWLITRIRPLLSWHIASFLTITAGSLSGLITPLVLRWIIDRILPERNLASLLAATALIFLSCQGRTVLTSLGGYLMLGASQKMGLALRVELLRHLDKLSADYYEKTPVGTILFPVRESIEEISYFGSDLLPAFFRLILTTGFTLGTMFWLCPALTLAVLPLLPVFLMTRQHFRKRLARDADSAQVDRVTWNSFLQEHVSSIVSIQLLGQEKRQERSAFQLWGRAVQSQKRLFETGMRFTIASSLAVALSMCAVLALGGANVWRGTVSIGSLVAFYGLVTQIFEPLSGVSELYARAQRVFASVRQVESILARRPNVSDAAGAATISSTEPLSIEFAEVVFGYERHPGLLYIPTLRLQPGEQIAIVGENGAGKSTLAKLIARLYDPLRGSIYLGTQDIRNIKLCSLRDHICYLAREPVLFEGSLAANLRFGCKYATEDEVRQAIESVGLSAFVSSLPAGLHQRFGPSGCQLSGGQRQRLAIARVFLQQPRILILDEATSSLDLAAERLILRNIRCGLPASTLIIVSHRASTVADFARIINLSGGRIVSDSAEGPHHGHYRDCLTASCVPSSE